MKRAEQPPVVALALTWDGARWPVKSLSPPARSFLGASIAPSPQKVAALLSADAVREIRICWVPRLKGGNAVLADEFVAPEGRRVAFRAVQTTPLGDLLGVVYRRERLQRR